MCLRLQLQYGMDTKPKSAGCLQHQSLTIMLSLK